MNVNLLSAATVRTLSGI